MTTTILYPYIDSEAQGDELRLSLRSLAENLKGDYQPCVIGDIPDWYTGDHIPLPRITQADYRAFVGNKFHPKWHLYVDQAWKFAAAASCDQISDVFVVMYDETYLMQSIDVDYLLTPRYRGEIAEKALRKNEYWDALIRSRERLLDRGLPIRDYDTHHPFPVDGTQLPECYEAFNPMVSPGSFPAQHLNWLNLPSQEHTPDDFQYFNRRKCESFEGIFPATRILNIGVVTPAIQASLETKFKQPSLWELQ